MLEAAISDLRYAVRSFARAPGFAAATVLTLAVGIGVSVAMFGVLHAVLIRPLPIRDQSRAMVLWAEAQSQPGVHVPLRNGVLWNLSKNNKSFSQVGAVMIGGSTAFMARDQDRTFPMALSLITGSYFPTLGAIPQYGRLLTPSDDEAGAQKVVVISDHLWRQQFGADPSVVGRTIDLQGASQTIVGVAPRGFDYPAGTDAWSSLPQMELRFSSTPNEDGGWYDLVGRLKAGVSRDQALAEFQTILGGTSSRALPDVSERVAGVRPIADFIVGDERPAILILTAAVTLLLIMTCANLAGLLLTRGLAREAELGMRASLGATRSRLVGQLMLESGLLALFGAALGIGIAGVLLKLAVILAPPGLARFDEARLDVPVVLFAIALTGVCVVAFALPPALRTAGSKLDRMLRQTSRSVSSGGWSRKGARPTLVIAQFAITVVVLVSSGLLLRTLAGLQRLNIGYEAEHLMFVVLQDTQGGGDEGAMNQRAHMVVDGLRERLTGQHGVVDVTPTYTVPFNGVNGAPVIERHFAVEGQGISEGLKSPSIVALNASPNYFRTLGMSLVRGRAFTVDDAPTDAPAGTPYVCIVSEALAQLAWPGQDAIGKRIRVVGEDAVGKTRTVIGIARNVRILSLQGVEPTLYAPLNENVPPAVVAIRTTGAPREALPLVRQVLAGVDQGWVIREAVTMPELLAVQLAKPRLLSAVLGTLSVGAIALAALGAFSVLALMVSARSREFGVRLALGATSRTIRELVLREGWRLAGIGVAIGLAMALAGTRMLRSQLYDVSPTDPATILAVVTFLLSIATLAFYIPARRAANADPIVALRHE